MERCFIIEFKINGWKRGCTTIYASNFGKAKEIFNNENIEGYKRVSVEEFNCQNKYKTYVNN